MQLIPNSYNNKSIGQEFNVCVIVIFVPVTAIIAVVIVIFVLVTAITALVIAITEVEQ